MKKFRNYIITCVIIVLLISIALIQLNKDTSVFTADVLASYESWQVLEREFLNAQLNEYEISREDDFVIFASIYPLIAINNQINFSYEWIPYRTYSEKEVNVERLEEKFNLIISIYNQTFGNQITGTINFFQNDNLIDITCSYRAAE